MFEGRWDVGYDGFYGRWRLFHPRLQLGERVLGAPRPALPDEHVVHDQTERVDVGALIDMLSLGLLRRHVLHGADHGAEHRGLRGCVCCQLKIVDDRGVSGHRTGNRASCRPRDAEVHDQRLVVVVDHDVGGFEVAVDHVRFVRFDQSGHDRARDPECADGRQPSLLPKHRGEIGSLDVRHRDVLDAADITEIMNADDVPVRDLPREQQLALETAFDFGRRLRIGHYLGANHLDGHRDREFRIPRLIHGAHAADAQQPDDVISTAEGFPNREWPVVSGF